MPQVLNKRRSNSSIPPGAVLVDRTTKWGNRFRIGMIYKGIVLTRHEVVLIHKDWFLYSDEGIELQKSLGELRDKDLVCWCVPLECHASILLELANV